MNNNVSFPKTVFQITESPSPQYIYCLSNSMIVIDRETGAVANKSRGLANASVFFSNSNGLIGVYKPTPNNKTSVSIFSSPDLKEAAVSASIPDHFCLYAKPAFLNSETVVIPTEKSIWLLSIPEKKLELELELLYDFSAQYHVSSFQLDHDTIYCTVTSPSLKLRKLAAMKVFAKELEVYDVSQLSQAAYPEYFINIYDNRTQLYIIENNEIKVWERGDTNLNKWNLVASLPISANPLAVFSPDRTRVAFKDSKRVYVIDCDHARLVTSVESAYNWSYSFSAQSNILYICEKDSVVQHRLEC